MNEIKYAQALEKLEEIIKQIENEEIDIDELSQKVQEASALIKVCREKVTRAELEVKDVVDSFDKEN